MRFHLVVSVILGFIVSIVLGKTSLFLGNFSHSFYLLGYVGFFFGGFVATYIAREANLKQGIYVGIILVLYYILVNIFSASVLYSVLINTIFLILVLTCFGGYFGKRGVDGSLRSFHPLAALIIGFIVTFVLLIFIVAIMDFLLPDSTFSLIITVILMGMLLIGGFTTTYISREKKLQYGIYLGVLTILFVLIWNFLVLGQLTQFNPLVKILATAGYLLTPTIGGHIGIKISKKR